MLINLLIWLYALCLLTGLGLIWGRWMSIDVGQSAPPDWADLLLVGFVSLMAALGVYSIFLPISLSSHLVALPIGLIGWMRHRSKGINAIRSWWSDLRYSQMLLPLALLLFLLCIQAYKEPWFFDVGLYHAQTIQWIQQYPVVPGLGNLHGRLAFNSHFHLLQAFLSFGTNFHQTGSGLVVIMVYIRVFSRGFALGSKQPLFWIIVLIWPIVGFWKWFSSPSPDLPVYYLLLCTWVYFLYRRESVDVVIALVFTLISFKFSAVVVATLLVLKPERVGAILVIGSLILGSWLVRNVYLSGYAIYPIYEVDVFDVDFKVPIEQSRAERDEIKLFARRPLADWELAKGQATTQWMGVWIANARKSDLVLLGLGLLTAWVHLLAWGRYDRGLRILVVILVGACAFWFANAPAMRFVYGFVIPLLAIQLDQVSQLFHTSLKSLKPMTYVVMLLLVLEVFRSDRLADHLLFPKVYGQHVSHQAIRVGHALVMVPSGLGWCWDTPIPCTPNIPDGLEMRGKKLADGFRIEEEN